MGECRAILREFAGLALAGAFLAGLATPPANAQNIDLAEMAAALVLPVVTGGHGAQTPQNVSGDVILAASSSVTLITVTNGSANSILLEIDLVNGDPGPGNWGSTSFECELTGSETTTFVFQQVAPGTTAVFVECSEGGVTDANPQAFFTGFDNGFMFIGVADPLTGTVLSSDVLFGDAIVVDTLNGQAYSFSAIPFQAGQGQNDGNKIYRFDNHEYAKFPAVLATNFLAPVSGSVQAELILFTLDGTTGSTPPPRAKLGGFVFNDDEESLDFSYEFDCFDIVSLTAINPNFAYIPGGMLGLGSLSGHLELVAQPTATANDSHDAQYGDGNNSRTRPVHGWLVQNVPQGAKLIHHVPGGSVVEAAAVTMVGGPAAWGRPLSQSTTAALPFLNDDDATLDADVRN